MQHWVNYEGKEARRVTEIKEATTESLNRSEGGVVEWFKTGTRAADSNRH
jgi:hypothetical protein